MCVCVGTGVCSMVLFHSWVWVKLYCDGEQSLESSCSTPGFSLLSQAVLLEKQHSMFTAAWFGCLGTKQNGIKDAF